MSRGRINDEIMRAISGLTRKLPGPLGAAVGGGPQGLTSLCDRWPQEAVTCSSRDARRGAEISPPTWGK